MLQTKFFLEKIETHFMFNNPPPWKIVIFYEVMWENVVQPDRPPQMTI